MKYGELAERVGVSAQAMGLFISGQKDPSLYRLHTMRNRGAIVRVIKREGKAVWQLQSADSTTTPSLQPDLFGLPADLEGVSPTP